MFSEWKTLEDYTLDNHWLPEFDQSRGWLVLKDHRLPSGKSVDYAAWYPATDERAIGHASHKAVLGREDVTTLLKDAESLEATVAILYLPADARVPEPVAQYAAEFGISIVRTAWWPEHAQY